MCVNSIDFVAHSQNYEKFSLKIYLKIEHSDLEMNPGRFVRFICK